MDKYQIAWKMLQVYLDGKMENSDNKFGSQVQDKIREIEKLLDINPPAQSDDAF